MCDNWDCDWEPTRAWTSETHRRSVPLGTSNVREYEQKFAELPEQQKLTKLCFNAGFSKNIDRGQFFIALDEEGPDDMKTSFREYTLP